MASLQSWLSTLKPKDANQISTFLINEGYDLTETFDTLASLSDTKLEKWLDVSGLNFRLQGILMKQIKGSRLETGYNKNNNNGNRNVNDIVAVDASQEGGNYNDDAQPAYGEGLTTDGNVPLAIANPNDGLSTDPPAPPAPSAPSAPPAPIDYNNVNVNINTPIGTTATTIASATTTPPPLGTMELAIGSVSAVSEPGSVGNNVDNNQSAGSTGYSYKQTTRYFKYFLFMGLFCLVMFLVELLIVLFGNAPAHLLIYPGVSCLIALYGFWYKEISITDGGDKLCIKFVPLNLCCEEQGMDIVYKNIEYITYKENNIWCTCCAYCMYESQIDIYLKPSSSCCGCCSCKSIKKSIATNDGENLLNLFKSKGIQVK